jgi:cytochrome c peroxidase
MPANPFNGYTDCGIGIGPDLLRAIASYERTQVSFDSPFDHFIAGDKNAIDDSAKRGWELFNTQARCNKCHALTDTQRDVTVFTDNDFHNIGIGRLIAVRTSPRSKRQTLSRLRMFTQLFQKLRQCQSLRF